MSFPLKFLIQTPFAVEKLSKKKEGFSSYIKEFLEGIKEIRKNHFAKIFVIIAPVINFSFSAVFSIVITYLFLEVFEISEYLYAIYRMTTAGVSLILHLLFLPVIKRFEPEKLLKYSSLSISSFLFLIGLTVFYGMTIGTEKIFLVVLLFTILDCLVLSSVMPLNIDTQVFFQKNKE